MITGGSSGIGFAVAERFLQEGARRVILVGRSYERLLNAAQRLQGNTTVSKEASASGDGDDDVVPVATRSPEDNEIGQGGDGTPLSRQGWSQGFCVAAADNISLLIGDVSSADQWIRELEKEMENVDILVNAAGISISNILPKTDPVDISKTLATNLEGAILTSRALLRACVRSRLRKRGDATTTTEEKPDRPLSKCIINISSLLALKGVTGTVTYAASKAGLLGLTRSVAVEAAETLRGVTVRSNAIVPGYIQTPMIEDFSSDRISRLKESIPLKRFGDPEEIADAAVFLASNEYANNCVLNLDGGLSAV
ncbi:hypothetical protein VTN77DRAFT_303 [Rasamsonia byssochlamydoides]|uniref:uncharacterized protein n=1 Tax=Rasamsonia byssochlamydoides TaxID=89139 RepID=UPI003743D75E